MKKGKTILLISLIILFIFSILKNFTNIFDLTFLFKNNNSDIQKILPTVSYPDYSDKSNWMYMDTSIKHEVDLLYFYQTAEEKSPDNEIISEINDINKANAKKSFLISGAAFSSYTNVFVPYWRQITLNDTLNVSNIKEYKELVRNSLAKNDTFLAMDYYFKYLNKGRPFILSSHSQGSVIVQLAFEEYFPKHPEYLKQMVAAYIIGFPVEKTWVEENNLKFAKNDNDTNVIISWCTEAPSSKGADNSEKYLSINPINWRTDNTHASRKANKGSINIKTLKIEKNIADATINSKRGTVVCSTQRNYTSLFKNLFGNKSFHIYDYSFYYENIKENGKKRIEKFLGHKIK